MHRQGKYFLHRQSITIIESLKKLSLTIFLKSHTRWFVVDWRCKKFYNARYETFDNKKSASWMKRLATFDNEVDKLRLATFGNEVDKLRDVLRDLACTRCCCCIFWNCCSLAAKLIALYELPPSSVTSPSSFVPSGIWGRNW